MKIWLNRLPSAFPRVADSFRRAGFDPIALPCLQSRALDISLDPAIVDFDRFSDVVVTSPESARLLIDAITSRWTQWPTTQRFWAVGSGTADILGEEVKGVITASDPGSASLIQVMRSVIWADNRLLIVTGRDSGRQFEQLNQTLSDPVSYLELFELMAGFGSEIQTLEDIVAVVHGSTVLVRAFINVAREKKLNVMQYTHFVTSADAKAQLPSGCRYHQINSPTPKAVRLAMQGEERVKD
ncbi:MAG TPA: hypothetical protein DEF72_00395 [Gammaproteobacteria bacterium]|mgnify:CR=1 FL=1|nr:hypothetical protein [Gammaproteobacteria bacterium]